MQLLQKVGIPSVENGKRGFLATIRAESQSKLLEWTDSLPLDKKTRLHTLQFFYEQVRDHSTILTVLSRLLPTVRARRGSLSRRLSLI
jgi:hypothetical protein